MSLEFVKNRANKGHTEGLWNEHVDTETGRSTYQEHELKTIANYCGEKDHFWELKGRAAVCSKCGMARPVIIGPQKVENGKITPI